jgi:hypothetical protein
MSAKHLRTSDCLSAGISNENRAATRVLFYNDLPKLTALKNQFPNLYKQLARQICTAGSFGQRLTDGR